MGRTLLRSQGFAQDLFVVTRGAWLRSYTILWHVYYLAETEHPWVEVFIRPERLGLTLTEAK